MSLTSSRGMSFAPHLFTHSRGIRLHTFIWSYFKQKRKKIKIDDFAEWKRVIKLSAFRVHKKRAIRSQKSWETQHCGNKDAKGWGRLQNYERYTISDIVAKSLTLPYYLCKCTSPNKNDTTPPSSGILTPNDTVVCGEAWVHYTRHLYNVHLHMHSFSCAPMEK